jgi:aminoglycoside 2'-N-acetyltransferase I
MLSRRASSPPHLFSIMSDDLAIQVKKSQALSAKEYSAILALCNQAFGRDISPIMKSFQNPVHVLGTYHRRLVSHVLWITRWLRIADGPLLRTAFIEATVTDLDYRHRDFASAVMKQATSEIQDFDIAALSTGSPGFYTRLGWQLWRGPLFLRKGKRMIPTPEEHGVMILSLPKTPPLDIYAPLSVEWRELEPW